MSVPGPPHVDLFFSFRSPYSYVGVQLLAGWAKSDGIDIALRPVLPLAIRNPEFFETVNPLGPPYVRMDSERTAEFHGLPFHWPNPDPVVMTVRPLNIAKEQPYIFRLTHLGCAAAQRGKGLAFAAKVSRLIWGSGGADWTEGRRLANAAAEAGLDLSDMDAAVAADAPAYDAMIEENQTAHRAAGHWGVPTMVFNGEPFFGQDRIEILKWRVAQARQ